MKIASVRLGHANNSSSTHSILLNSRMEAKPSASGDFQYGWDWFHLKDRESKSKYLATLIYNILSSDGMAPEQAGIIARDLTAYNPFSETEDHYAYVDHQSVPVLPRKMGENYIRHDFLTEFVSYVRDNDSVTIRGGNDNEDDPRDKKDGLLDWMPDEETPYLGQRPSVNALPFDHPKLRLFGRKDRGWWALYNQESGAKIRLSFEANPVSYLAASKPELVDIKITDFCPFACSFCYQNSTEKGKHAKLDYIRALAYELGQAEVFEVALGGGETTLHPDFPAILAAFAMYGVTPNFTTFNMAWTKNKEIKEYVKKHCRSFAVSNPAELDALAKWNANREREGPRGTLQIPMGCYPEGTLKAVITKAREKSVPVTFLGFKDHGRGTTFKPEDYRWVIDFLITAQKWEQFGADTLFVNQFKEDLKRHGISETLMVAQEGAFSCYIDAVNQVMGASSYTKDLHEVRSRDVFGRFPYVRCA